MSKELLEETKEVVAARAERGRTEADPPAASPASSSRAEREFAQTSNGSSPSAQPPVHAKSESNESISDDTEGDETIVIATQREEHMQLSPDTMTRKKQISNIVGWTVTALVVLATIIIGTFLLRNQVNNTATEKTTGTSESASTGNSLSPDQRAAIAVEVVQKQFLRSDVTAPGKVAFNGNRISPVFSQFSGRLVQLNAEVGSTVRAGQIIGMIDTPDIVTTQSDYQQALTTARSARTALDLAIRTRERAERLTAAEAIPLRELQQAQADEARARDDLARAQSAIAAGRGRLQSAGMSDSDIARLISGARPVNHLVPLIAPITGTITERKAGINQVVQPGAGDPLLVIADLSSVWVNAEIYEDQVANVRVGSSVKIQTPAYPNETFAARVDQIGSVVDPDKHTLAVRCIVPNLGERLKPGMFASMILSAVAPHLALTVPASAIVTEGDKRAVFVEDAPNHFVKRIVVTGAERDDAVIVQSGVTEGERVVVRGGLLVAAQQGAE